tara:strand:+ start:874 stop:1707 length:834 start_codon:yes stop_codon:yes gene_type:complete
MIIWLASYPKSGNTWVRVFLNSLFYTKNNDSDINNLTIGQFPNRKHFENITKNIDDINEFSKNCINAQLKLNLSNETRFLKTHHAYWQNEKYKFTDVQTTLGVIYIVRDPRNVITSLKNHFNFDNYNEALKFLLDDRKVIGIKNSKREADLPHIISSWKNHFNSWKKMSKNYLLIKYENLINSPEIEFQKITNYLEKLLNKKFEKKKFLDAIKKSNFDNLKKKEKANGFIEAPISLSQSNLFFNMGPKNDWRKLLDKEISEQIERKFKAEMLELNYL